MKLSPKELYVLIRLLDAPARFAAWCRRWMIEDEPVLLQTLRALDRRGLLRYNEAKKQFSLRGGGSALAFMMVEKHPELRAAVQAARNAPLSENQEAKK